MKTFNKIFIMKRFFKFVCVTFVFLITSVLGYYYFMQEELIFRCKRLDPNHTYTFSTPFEEVNLPVGEGEFVNGVHFFHENPKGVILYLHGQGRDMLHWGERAQKFVAYGYDVFVIDYRGWGKSTNNVSEKNMMEDSLAAYAYLKERYNEDQIVVQGVSLGTAMASYVSTKNNPRDCILIAPYYNMIETAHYNKPILPRFVLKFILKYHLRTDTWITKANCPLHIFHGTKDRLIPYCQSEMIVEKLEDAGSDYKFHTLEGWGHNYVYQNEIYLREVDKLLRS